MMICTYNNGCACVVCVCVFTGTLPYNGLCLKQGPCVHTCVHCLTWHTQTRTCQPATCTHKRTQTLHHNILHCLQWQTGFMD